MVQISEELIIRFINSTCTDEELVAIKNWLDESDENVIKLFETEQMATLAECMRKDDSARTRIAEGIKQRIDNEEIRTRRRVKFAVIEWVSGIAAMLAIILGIGFHYFHKSDIRMIYVAATTDSRSVTLPDSSVVYLNKNSQLAYPEYFADDSRNVTLRGEGYFKVNRDINKPFKVSGDYLTVEVLGTTFNFISRQDSINSVSLVDGSVEVTTTKQNEGVVLVPGQKAVYSVSSGQLTVQATNAAVDCAWHNKIIPFESASLSDIVAILNQLYNVDIEIDGNSELDKTYSGVTVFYDDIDSTLTHLSHTLPIKFINKRDHIIVSIK
ncbi:FecR family protein [Duncaniella muris]|uniref:FecR family protein n=1 Tax=Duncaniella muris TaxID=2094150 RepID=UPI00263B207A|nr:FecR domain-containing protein [Duncaniella muris]